MKTIEVFNQIIYINENNGSFSFYKEDVEDDKIIDENEYIQNFRPKTITLCIPISNQCNMACRYCFNDKKNATKLDFSDFEYRINEFINKFSFCEKYYIDLSGKGEPLLNLDFILHLSDFCMNKSKKIKKDIVITFVTNGLLLSKKVVKILQKRNILFGVSIDGSKEIHNQNRVKQDGSPTYDLIIKNIKKIKHREYLGCAMTITNNPYNLLDSLLEMSNYFDTISVKPVRGLKYGLNESSLLQWRSEYRSLATYLLLEIQNGRWILLKKLLNGEDYFGKFLYRCFYNTRVLHRCDAGISRFTIEKNGKVFGCPAATMLNFLELADIDYQHHLESQIREQKDRCAKCHVFFLCGGECQIERINYNGQNKILCEFKKELIGLAMYIKLVTLFDYFSIFQEIYEFCEEKSKRK